MKRSLIQLLAVAILLLLAHDVTAQPAQRPENPPVKLALEDQFEVARDITAYRGQVLVLLYGDRKGMPANKELGERLQVQYHPTAKGLTPSEAAKAPVTPLPGLAQGVRSPDVKVMPVAVIGQVPELVKNIIRNRVKKEAGDSIVLLDFSTKMKDEFGMTDGEPNLALIDAKGRVRLKMSGALNATNYQKLTQWIDFLRNEAVK